MWLTSRTEDSNAVRIAAAAAVGKRLPDAGGVDTHNVEQVSAQGRGTSAPGAAARAERATDQQIRELSAAGRGAAAPSLALEPPNRPARDRRSGSDPSCGLSQSGSFFHGSSRRIGSRRIEVRQSNTFCWQMTWALIHDEAPHTREAVGMTQIQRSTHVLLATAAAVFALPGCVDGAAWLAELSPEARSKAPVELVEGVLADIERQEPRSLVIGLAAPEPEPAVSLELRDALRVMRFAALKTDMQRDLGPDLVVDEEYDHLPVTVATVTTPAAWAALLEDPRVAVVDDVRQFEASAGDVESLALVGQPTALAGGKDGSGVAVAVIDTGADYTRPAFGSCTAPGVPSTCRVVVAQDFGTNDNLRDDASLHGTNVAGVVAQTAPGARILALDVFDGSSATSTAILSAIDFVVANRAAYNIAALNLSLGFGGFTAPCANDPLAIAVGTARTAGVLSSVASGNDGYLNATSSPACAPAAVSVGAVYDANLGGLGFGMCSDPVTAADRVTCFSNSASFLTVLAPGAIVTAADVSMTGTSQAAPHVAAAIAVLKGAFPTEGPDALVARLKSTGRMVTDPRNGIVTPRIDLGAASVGCVVQISPTSQSVDAATTSFVAQVTTGTGCTWTIASDVPWMTPSVTSGSGSMAVTINLQQNTGAGRSGNLNLAGAGVTRTLAVTQGVDAAPPTGTVVINNNDTTTRSATVAISITASDPSGVAAMCVTESDTCTTFEPFNPTKAFSLLATGNRTVRVFLRDGRGNTSSATTAPQDSIIFDNLAPTDGTLTVAPGIGSLQLSWTAATDALSGVARYRVMAGSTTPTNCTTGTPVYEGSALSFTHTGLTNGVTVAYRVCAIDGAGNVATGAVGTGAPRVEITPPTGTLTINGGAAFTKTTAVTLAITAQDPSGVAAMCLTTTTTCTTFEPVVASKAFTLPVTSGAVSVRLFLRDNLGNTSTTAAATATITIDTTAPTGGTLSAQAATGQVALSWTAATDAGSGVASYRLVFATTAAPTSCTTGTIIYEGTALTFTHSGLVNQTTYGYRVCASDRVGNVAAGVTALAQPRVEFAAPTGSVVINNGAAYTGNATVTVSISATDASGVAGMCISTTSAACTTFVAYATSASVTLPNVDGVQTVYVTLKDTLGNVTATPLTDTIGLDRAAPVFTSLSVFGQPTGLSFAWSAVDAGVGMGAYRLVIVPGTTAPAAGCTNGTQLFDGAATSFVDAARPRGSYAYRVCARDAAGTVNEGLVVFVNVM